MTESAPREFGSAARRIRLIARHTLIEAVHLRLTGLLAIMAAGLVVGSHWLREFNFGTAEIAFLGDYGLGAIGVLGSLLAALATAHLFFADLAAGAAACALTRPVRRSEYLVGKLAGVSALLAVFTAVLGTLMGALMSWRSLQLGAPAVGVSIFLSACSLQWMKCTLVAGMTLGVCAYAGSAMFATCAGLLLTMIGHLRPFAVGSLEWLRVWPNLALFDGSAVWASGHGVSATMLLQLVSYWTMCLMMLGGIAAYGFKYRDF